MKSLIIFSVVVATVLVVLLVVAWFYKGGGHFNFKNISIFLAGYAIGWITLFIKIVLLGLK